MEETVKRLIVLFNELFSESHNTRLIAGKEEPIYLPADRQTPYHRIVFAHGYFASVMHEVAHWCVAGDERRLLEDFGYWYRPDGRTSAQQAEFEQVEVRPQAMEWVFSQACQRKFHASADNLNGQAHDDREFRFAVANQARIYIRSGLPSRASQWSYALQKEFGGSLHESDFFWPDQK
ncbi:MAG: elongation factor P hydroxylase [Gammaproteobacteria bacterium]|nr:elongation factor P hydroxylase [Gammaproteobacteria bacterium]